MNQVAKSTKNTCVIEWIDFGMFPGGLLFIQGFKYKEVVKHLKKEKANEWLIPFQRQEDIFEDGRWTTVRCVDEGRESYFIILPDACDLTNLDHVVSLAHECLHICQLFLPQLAINRDEEYECEAYFHSYLMKKIITAIKGEGPLE
jgi:hypothetical protein